MVASLLRGPRLSVFLCIILATLWLSFVYCFFLPQAFPQLCPLLLERVECALRGVASSPLCRLLPVLQQVRQREEREHRWLSMVLAVYVLFNYCRSYKELSESLLGWFAFSGVSHDRVVLVHFQP